MLITTSSGCTLLVAPPRMFIKTVLFLCNSCFAVLVYSSLCISAKRIFPVDPEVAEFRKWLLQSSLTNDFIIFSSHQPLDWKTILMIKRWKKLAIQCSLFFLVFGITKWVYQWGAYLVTSLNVSSGMGLFFGGKEGLIYGILQYIYIYTYI